MMTMITDYILGAITIAFGVGLWRARTEAAPRCWAAALVVSGAGAIAGGTYHGVHDAATPLTLAALWKSAVYLIGIAALLLVISAASATLSPRTRGWIELLAVIQFVVYGFWMIRHDDFRFVIYDYALSLLTVAALFLAGWRRQRDAARWVVSGILLSFAAAAVQHLRVAPHPRFDHNDLYHVVQIAAMWTLYRGGRLMRSGGISPLSAQ